MSHRSRYLDRYWSEDLDQVDDPRRAARRQIHRRRRYVESIAGWVVLCAFVVAIWAFDGRGYFWPGWVIAGAAVLLTLRGWRIYAHKPITEGDIDAELQRHKPTRG
jgi:fatty acid desaturase